MQANIFSDLSRVAAEVFVAGLWQGLIFIGAVTLCLRFLSRASASTRFAIWSFTFALVIAIPFLQLRGVPTISNPIAIPAAVVHASPVWALVIAALWGMISFIRLAQLLIQVTRVHRIWKRAAPVASTPETQAVLTQSRSAQLCTSSDVDSPCVIGFLSPRLLVPQTLFYRLIESELHQIVLHECEHLRRRDDWINFAQKVALALFPLNPALLFVERRLSLERELACDAGVISRTSAPFDYARCLTRLAEHHLQTRNLALALSAWSRQSELARRVHTLLKPMRSLSPVYARASVAVLTVALTAGAVELAHTPRLISFTGTPTTPVATGVDTVYHPASLQPIPVRYSQAADQPHATLLRATLPASKPVAAAKRTAKQPRRESSKPRPRRLLRTAAIPPSDTAPNTVRAYYITTDFSPSYAAVPIGDGWLIVQL
jgi:beta-lactamase regulating signal transducer with metallopeptidase domain